MHLSCNIHLVLSGVSTFTQTDTERTRNEQRQVPFQCSLLPACDFLAQGAGAGRGRALDGWSPSSAGWSPPLSRKSLRGEEFRLLQKNAERMRKKRPKCIKHVLESKAWRPGITWKLLIHEHQNITNITNPEDIETKLSQNKHVLLSAAHGRFEEVELPCGLRTTRHRECQRVAWLVFWAEWSDVRHVFWWFFRDVKEAFWDAQTTEASTPLLGSKESVWIFFFLGGGGGVNHSK